MIEIEVDQKDLDKIIRALERIEQIADEKMAEAIPKELAQAYAMRVREAILAGRISYAPYNPRYAAWKTQYGRAVGFWQLYGDLVRHITVYKKADGWQAGIASDVMDSGGKSWFGAGDYGEPRSIAMYGWVMELGGNYKSRKGGVHPARPIFEPMLNAFVDYGTGSILNRHLTEIERAWS